MKLGTSSFLQRGFWYTRQKKKKNNSRQVRVRLAYTILHEAGQLHHDNMLLLCSRFHLVNRLSFLLFGSSDYHFFEAMEGEACTRSLGKRICRASGLYGGCRWTTRQFKVCVVCAFERQGFGGCGVGHDGHEEGVDAVRQWCLYVEMRIGSVASKVRQVGLTVHSHLRYYPETSLPIFKDVGVDIY
jgi:hypothetical protein